MVIINRLMLLKHRIPTKACSSTSWITIRYGPQH